jgi:hypothetical protein
MGQLAGLQPLALFSCRSVFRTALECFVALMNVECRGATTGSGEIFAQAHRGVAFYPSAVWEWPVVCPAAGYRCARLSKIISATIFVGRCDRVGSEWEGNAESRVPDDGRRQV